MRRIATRRKYDQGLDSKLIILSAAGALTAFGRVRPDDAPLIELVAGVPAAAPEAWRLTATARLALDDEDAAVGNARPVLSRAVVALQWALSRGRVSSTELASVVGASATNVGAVLRSLENTGDLHPSRATRRGAGFYYVPVTPEN